MRYRIDFAESVKEHLRFLTARERAIIFDAVEKQLLHEPLTETRNRKLLRPNPLAPWELRMGDLRVFYDVGQESPDTVRILAVGMKKGNRLSIAGKEITL